MRIRKTFNPDTGGQVIPDDRMVTIKMGPWLGTTAHLQVGSREED
jgi:hypothetical protein